MNHAYEDLSGGVGRSAYFRARRYRARAVMNQLAPEVLLGDVSVSLYDFSSTGLAVRVPEMPKQIALGTIVPLSLRLNRVSAFSGHGQVVRAQGGTRWMTLGVKLLDGVLDPAELKTTHDRLVMEEAVARGASHFLSVSPQYRQLCGDAAFFLNYWRLNLGHLETGGTGGISGQLASEIEGAAEKRMREEWGLLRARGNELTGSLSSDDPTFVATKRYTEILLTPLTLGAPIWKRAYEKPLGYPGDYELMTYMYDDVRRGETAFDRVLHQLGREERLAATVPSRKNLLLRVIQETVRKGKEKGVDRVNLLSIGAGPAREIEEFLVSSAEAGPPLLVSLIDQDEEALSYACERMQRALLRSKQRVEIRPRYIAFNQLLARGDLLEELRGQDLIYSAGLVDYLSDRVAQGLLALCYELLAPYGLLLLGNALVAPDVRWVPEFILDWHMIYRSEAELRTIGSVLSGGAKVSTKADQSSAWCFLSVEKPPSVG